MWTWKREKPLGRRTWEEGGEQKKDTEELTNGVDRDSAWK